ncbi:hypothetical protein [Pseudonocardia kunmingensis]|uniref:Uncharacterized protein n=1 Tax=Pseudonocardia kunmingensis TaxID=630975 RepID=A0A543E326_9PSEU|nr:hypothetical protein [Pseudonocardia kunmingensis]TQM15987.1 hypothetical protein FB558_2786 [Pseudonocardia kunmingensis]
MPIRTSHGRSAAYRAIWAWPLRSPVRLAVTVVVVVALAVGVTLAVAFLNGTPPGGAAPDDGTTTAGPSTRGPGGSGPPPSPTPTMLPPVPALTPSPLPLSQAPDEAIEVAALWSAAWVRPAEGTTAQEWLEGLRPTTTDEYLGVLSGVDPGNIPATRVTGEPRPVAVASSSVQVEVPTDALTLVVLVVDTEAGWRVAGYDRA